MCIGKPGIWLSRIRMGLSALNAHRFKYNFIDSPNCEQCNNGVESPIHYFIHCQAYGVARQTLLDNLRLEPTLNINNPNSILQTILHGTSHAHTNKRIYTYVSQYITDTGRFN